MIGQMSIFDLIESASKEFDVMEALALRGTGFAGGMKRVKAFFQQEQSLDKRAKFLKAEYGIYQFQMMISRWESERMKKQNYNGQWFLLPVIGIKRCDLWVERVYQYNLCLAWLNFGIDIKICRKKY